MSSSVPHLAVVRGGPVSTDVELERQIDYQTLLLHSSPDRDVRVAACEELKRLVARRSPERIEAMEANMGIRVSYKEIRALKEEWIQFKDTPKRWQIIRDAYQLMLPRIMEGNANPYFLNWDFTPIERLAWMDIRGSGLPLYPQFPVGRVFIDFADPVLKIGVELDGAAFHQHARDYARDASLAKQGWRIFRVPGREAVKIVVNPFESEYDLKHSGRWRDVLLEWGMADSTGFFWALERVYYKPQSADRDVAREIVARHQIADFDIGG
jgi:very-short-patch-repair endonuclease